MKKRYRKMQKKANGKVREIGEGSERKRRGKKDEGSALDIGQGKIGVLQSCA